VADTKAEGTGKAIVQDDTTVAFPLLSKVPVRCELHDSVTKHGILNGRSSIFVGFCKGLAAGRLHVSGGRNLDLNPARVLNPDLARGA
jgi:hypothetical protein